MTGTVGDQLTAATKLELATIVFSPAFVAGHFGAMVGQFYDRAAFDKAARAAYLLYSVHSARQALRFRGRLDAILTQRGEAPIDWSLQ